MYNSMTIMIYMLIVLSCTGHFKNNFIITSRLFSYQTFLDQWYKPVKLLSTSICWLLIWYSWGLHLTQWICLDLFYFIAYKMDARKFRAHLVPDSSYPCHSFHPSVDSNDFWLLMLSLITVNNKTSGWNHFHYHPVVWIYLNLPLSCLISEMGPLSH